MDFRLALSYVNAMDPICWTSPAKRLPPDMARLLAGKAVEREPDNAEAHARLGRATLLDAESAASAWRRAIELDEAVPDYHFQLGRSLIRLEDYHGAIEACQTALDREHPAPSAVRALLADAQRRTGQLSEACNTAREALTLNPANVPARNYLIEALRDLEQLEEAERVCVEGMENDAFSTKTLAHFAVILAELGRGKACRELLDFDRFLKPIDLKTMAGGEDIDTLNMALVSLIRENRDRFYEPPGYPVYRGYQRLLENEKHRPPIQRLTSLLHRAINTFIRGLNGPHPWLKNAPRETCLDMWAVTLEIGGHQTPHVHFDGWMSGVYYLEVPPGDQEIQPPPGSIVFGPPPNADHRHSCIPVRSILPYPGLLLLFPSYVFHHLIPTTSTSPRTCIAFDVL